MSRVDGGEVVYICSRCKQQVKVYVPAAVRCSRCAQPMRPQEKEDGTESSDS